jgi:hypothetical protein
MEGLGLSRYALAMGAAAALLAGCGGSQGQGIGASGMTPKTVKPASRRAHQASSSNGELVYVVTDKAVLMASYPQGKIVGSIPFYSRAASVCSDPRNGNVFIPEGYTIYEYAHGGSVPIATLSVPSGYDALGGCSVDPMTGNLAQMAGGGVLIYPKAQGTPAAYSYKNAGFTYPAYDDSGNLFLGADIVKGKFRNSQIAEIRAGKTRFTFINVSTDIGYPVKIQWDGSYLTVKFEPSNHQYAIAQIQITGKTGTVVNSVPLKSAISQNFYWIQDSLIFAVVGHLRHNNWGIGAWRYPKGGSPKSSFYGIKSQGIGDITVSVAPSDSHIR